MLSILFSLLPVININITFHNCKRKHGFYTLEKNANVPTLFETIAHFAEYCPALVMLRAEWWRAQAAQAPAQMMTLSPVPWGPGLWLVHTYHVTSSLASHWSDVSCPLRPERDGDWPTERAERYILYLRDIVSANIQIMPASLSHLSPSQAHSGHVIIDWKRNNTSSTKFSNMWCVQILSTKFTTISRMIMPGSGFRIR